MRSQLLAHSPTSSYTNTFVAMIEYSSGPVVFPNVWKDISGNELALYIDMTLIKAFSFNIRGSSFFSDGFPEDYRLTENTIEQSTDDGATWHSLGYDYAVVPLPYRGANGLIQPTVKTSILPIPEEQRVYNSILRISSRAIEPIKGTSNMTSCTLQFYY